MSEAAFADNVLLFGRVLRRAGLDVHHGRLVDSLQALEWIGIGSRTDVRATLRGLLVHRHEDLARFDEAFDLFFAPHRSPEPGLPLFSIGERARVVAKSPPGEAVHVELESAAERAESATRTVAAYSATEVLRTKAFADFTPAELDQARELLMHLPWRLGMRRTRRWERAPGGAIDLRPVLRRSLLRGEPLDLPRRRRRDAPRPLVLLGDVSGSMERYSRLLLHFVYGIAQSEAGVESFLFATRLTRVTRRLADRGGDRIISRVVRDVQDWGGGTRIGDALRVFNTRWARRVMRHGPVVLIVSDGWDRGDPAVLARELARVRRHSRRLIWLNPLLGIPGYEPLTRGMQAALRHIDDFLPAHNLVSLEILAEHLRRVGGRGGNGGHGKSPARRHGGAETLEAAEGTEVTGRVQHGGTEARRRWRPRKERRSREEPSTEARRRGDVGGRGGNGGHGKSPSTEARRRGDGVGSSEV